MTNDLIARYIDDGTMWRDDRDELREENQRLRKALEDILDREDYACYSHYGDKHNDCVISIARAALEKPR